MPEKDVSDMSPEEVAEMQKQNCIFCKIVEGEVPSRKVYEDEQMLAIMDIRPAREGHILVLPKEHYPVLPVVPHETSRHMFERTKDLCNAVRKGMPAMGTSVFIANGAAAGQQSPHFLFHIVPRDSGDGLDAFHVPSKGVDQQELLEPLQKGVGQAMKAVLAQEGRLPGEGQAGAAKQQLAMVLENNPEVRRLLMQEPEKFKQMVAQNPQLQQVFQDVDIDKLASKLREMQGGEGEPKERSDVGDDEDDGEDADLDKVSRLFK